MNRAVLERFFDPRSVAVVGASADPAKRGHQIVRALTESGFSGRIHPVNPRGGELLGVPVVPSVDDLPEGVDLAVLCTPADAAPSLVRACGRKGVAGVIVLAVGFGESGAEGRALEQRLRDAGREGGVRIIGPNTSGLLNLHAGVNLVGARGVRAGGLAVLVQSGNMALALMTEVTERSWDGVSICLGVGNQIDVGFPEALDYLARHEPTRAVLVHVEGFSNPGAFLAVASKVCRDKPVVLLKSGRTAPGAHAALSHTGALAGPYDRLRAGLAQAGVVELSRTDELLHVAETLARQPVPHGDAGIAILADGGGQGALAVDRLVEAGGRLAELSEGTRAGLRELLGPAAAVANPVDLAGAADGDPTVFARAMERLVADPAVGTVLVVGLFGGYAIRFAEALEEAETAAAEGMADRARLSGRGLVVHTMYAAHRSAPLEVLGERGVPVVASLDVACRCVVELQRRGARLGRATWAYEPPAVPGGTAGERRALTEPEARNVLAGAGLRFGPSVLADTPDEVVDALGELGAPVAIKLVSETISHKSEAGGVVLGVTSAEEAEGAYRSVREGALAYVARHGLPTPSGTRVMVVPQEPPPRVELLVGAYRDPDLGPVLTIGAGGVWVEALADAAVRLLPIEDEDVHAMLAELRIWPILQGGRGRPPVDRAPVVAAAAAVAETMRGRDDVVEVEVNPLFVHQDRAVPVDARVVVVATPSGANDGPGGRSGAWTKADDQAPRRR